MARKKTGRKAKTLALTHNGDELAALAVRSGLARAEAIIADRRRELQRFGPMAVAGSLGLLIAEGDSWFKYPTSDILDRLRLKGFTVEHDAEAGDSIQQMVRQLPSLQRLIERQPSTPPRAVLLSGGGNDIVDRDTFRAMLNRKDSLTPGWNMPAVRDLIDNKIRGAYMEMIGAITGFCIDKWQRPIPILVHGYSHPVPDNRPAWIKGPWLAPVFIEKGYDDGHGYPDLPVCTPLAAVIINELNTMLSLLPANPQVVAVNPQVIYVDVRPELSSELANKKWKKSWSNEMHPTEEGFERVTQRLMAAIP